MYIVIYKLNSRSDRQLVEDNAYNTLFETNNDLVGDVTIW